MKGGALAKEYGQPPGAREGKDTDSPGGPPNDSRVMLPVSGAGERLKEVSPQARGFFWIDLGEECNEMSLAGHQIPPPRGFCGSYPATGFFQAEAERHREDPPQPQAPCKQGC